MTTNPKGAAHVELRAVSKGYAGVHAVNAVDLRVSRGSVHALVGANGAGKSTLGKIIAGAISPDAGEVRIDGRTARHGSPRDALQSGVALIAQELALAEELSVLENVFLGTEPRRGWLVDRAAMRSRFTALLRSSTFELDPDRRVRTLSTADQQKVEILRALNRRADVIVMDEPTSSLTRDEVGRLHGVIRRLRDEGRTVVYVSHFLDEVLELADEITVLRNGGVVRSGPAKGETEASLVRGMLGHQSDAEYPERGAVRDEPPVLRVEGLTRTGVIDDVSLTIRPGEILGLAGLVGSGRTEIARAIFGADRTDAGRIEIDGVELASFSPREAIDAGMAMVPESRKEQGLVLQQSARANTTLPHLRFGAGGRRGWIAAKRETAAVGDLLGRLDIKPASPDAVVGTMSGGNQQKVVFGKCLFRRPSVLLLDEPTRGVDIGARGAIHRLIGDLAREGVAILLISSDLEEVLALAHRVLVLRKGRIVAEFAEDPQMDDVMEAAFGLSTTTAHR